MARRHISVRMYRVGFGDCFLFTFPGPLHMLVDCGSSDRKEHLGAVASDIFERTKGHLHVIVASHRHRDHVSGFASESDVFRRMTVDEVWLPYTDDPGDLPQAALRRQHDGIARVLQKEPEPIRSIAVNATSDALAMESVLEGFASRPRVRFLAAGEILSDLSPGLHARVLGPVRSEEVQRRMEVEAGLAEMTLDAEARSRGPFASRYRVDRRTGRALFRHELAARPLLDEITSQAREEVGFWLDKTLNNTSLVLLVRFEGMRLLLPGDAQLDGWLPGLLRPDLVEELAAVSFYKVSHHGSHNGTPVRTLQALRKKALRSMVSANGTSGLPERELLLGLGKRGSVLRSDRGADPRAGGVGGIGIDLDLAL